MVGIFGKERLHLGIAGAYTHNLVLTFEHPPQAVGTALFIFYN